ncbi:hypothetical protein HAX54_029696, partial [Datura stramonium]|nr:hypothetical protein [Datura stramonium]
MEIVSEKSAFQIFLYLEDILTPSVFAVELLSMTLLDIPLLKVKSLVFFGNHLEPPGIPRTHWNIRRILNKWLEVKAKNRVHQEILQVIPIIILWEVWRSWAAFKFGDNNKMNSYDGTTGKAGIGGVVRNNPGDLIMSFLIPISCGSNNEAEVLAANYGLKWFLHYGFDKAMEVKEVTITQCYRKSNGVVDYFAKLATASGINTFCFSYQQLLRE